MVKDLLKQEFVRRMKKIIKEKAVRIGTLESFRKRYGLKEVKKGK